MFYDKFSIIISLYHHMYDRQIIDTCLKYNVHKHIGLTLFMLIVMHIAATAGTKTSWTPLSPAIDDAQSALEEALRTDTCSNATLASLYSRLERAAGASHSPEAQSRLAYWEAELALRQKRPSQSILDILDSTMPPDSARSAYDRTRFNFIRLKILLYHEKNYPEAYRLCEQMQPALAKEGYRAELALLLAMKGFLYYVIDDHEDALRCQYEAREKFAGTLSTTDSLRNELNICNTLAMMGQHREAVAGLGRLAQTPQAMANRKLHVNVMMSLYHFTNNGAYARRAHSEALETNDETLKMKTLQNLSEILYNDGDIAGALDIQKRVYNFFGSRRDPDMIVPLRGIVDIYEAMGRDDSALVYMRRLVAAQDTFSHVENMALINRMKARSEISNLQVNMNLAEARAALERRKSLIIFILCVAMIIMGVMAWGYHRRRLISDKRLREIENERLSVNLHNERLQNEQFQSAIDAQGRELTSKALLVLNKNRMLTELLDKIHEFAAAGTLPTPQAKILEKKIKEQLNSDNHWEDFTRHFEQMNPRFFQRLKESYPQLTDKDLKLCAYIRLGLTSKQISQMLSVLPESVNTTRYRLRRKMQLPPDVSLEDTLRKM